MFAFVKSPRIGAQVMIPVIGLLLFMPAFFHQSLPDPLVHTGEGFLYSLWKELIDGPLWIQIAATLLTALLTVLLLIVIDARHRVIEDQSFAVPWVFIFVITSSGQFFRLHPAYPAALFLLLSYHYALELYESRKPQFAVFNMVLMYGISVLIYPPLLWLIPLVLLAGMMMSTEGRFRIWIFLAGMAAPFLFALATFYLTGGGKYVFQDFFRWFEFRHTWPPVWITVRPRFWIWLAIMTGWILWGSLHFRSQKNLSRQFFLLLFVQFLICTAAMIMMETVGTEMIWIIVLPVSFLMANWIQRARSGWFRDLFFLFLLGFWIFFNLSGWISLF
ncbi:MAG: hypothetical protein J7L89_09265 [Bacteroidales bacterium]|nr:hypothetical protein [Bacteroidales bacterium]